MPRWETRQMGTSDLLPTWLRKFYTTIAAVRGVRVSLGSQLRALLKPLSNITAIYSSLRGLRVASPLCRREASASRTVEGKSCSLAGGWKWRVFVMGFLSSAVREADTSRHHWRPAENPRYHIAVKHVGFQGASFGASWCREAAVSCGPDHCRNSRRLLELLAHFFLWFFFFINEEILFENRRD